MKALLINPFSVFYTSKHADLTPKEPLSLEYLTTMTRDHDVEIFDCVGEFPGKFSFLSNDRIHVGTSLWAMAKLAKTKGYELVRCESSGVNAFFVKKELLTKDLREVSVEDSYYPHSRRLKKESTAQQWERVKHLKWMHVARAHAPKFLVDGDRKC